MHSKPPHIRAAITIFHSWRNLSATHLQIVIDILGKNASIIWVEYWGQLSLWFINFKRKFYHKCQAKKCIYSIYIICFTYLYFKVLWFFLPWNFFQSLIDSFLHSTIMVLLLVHGGHPSDTGIKQISSPIKQENWWKLSNNYNDLNNSSDSTSPIQKEGSPDFPLPTL